MMGHWHQKMVCTMGQHFGAELVVASVKCKTEMLPILPGLGLGLVVGEEEEINLPWGMQNTENEIEQTTERMTAGACWIYCY